MEEIYDSKTSDFDSKRYYEKIDHEQTLGLKLEELILDQNGEYNI